MKDNNKIKGLKLTEEEHELAQDFFYASDGFKIVVKMLKAIADNQAAAITTRHVELSDDKAQKDLICDKIQLQGMNKLIKHFEQLK